MYRTFFLALARKKVIKTMISTCPATPRVRDRFIAGTDWASARTRVGALVGRGMKASVGHLGLDARSPDDVETAVGDWLAVIADIGASGWAEDVDISINLGALGLNLRDGDDAVVAATERIAAAAQAIGTSVTINMGTPASLARTVRVVQALRPRYPSLGVTLPANLRRAEIDARTLSTIGGRVRLCKGSALPVNRTSYTDAHDVDLSFVRCLKALMEGEGTPLVATHDPVMIEIAQELAAHSNRGLKDFEFELLMGVRPIEQERLADLGHTVRVYVPYGPGWYEYLVQRVAESPLNLLSFVRGLIG